MSWRGACYFGFMIAASGLREMAWYLGDGGAPVHPDILPLLHGVQK